MAWIEANLWLLGAACIVSPIVGLILFYSGGYVGAKCVHEDKPMLGYVAGALCLPGMLILVGGSVAWILFLISAVLNIIAHVNNGGA